jgi:hypothetical protein
MNLQCACNLIVVTICAVAVAHLTGSSDIVVCSLSIATEP